MVSKKLPNSKSTEELLKDLDSAQEEFLNDTTKPIDQEDTIITFLRFYNIEPGTQQILQKYLYKLYKQFTKDPVNSRSFSNSIIQYIPSIVKHDERFFLINQKVLNLSERAMKFIEEDKNRSLKVSWKFHFDNFIKKYEIKAGKGDDWIWVSSDILYNLYDKWVYEIGRKTSLLVPEFRKLCKVYFSTKEGKHSPWYKLDNSILKHVSPEMDSGIKARNSSNNEKKEKQKK